jgi:uncharacterized protein YndB with AHSA1/START domain
MKIAKWILIVVGVLVVVFLAGAMMISPTYKVERVMLINAPPEKIYPLIATPREWPKWGIWFEREKDMKVDFAGAESGTGAKWGWASKEGRGEMEFTRAEPGKFVEYALYFPDMGVRSKGALTLTPSGSATRLSWTNEGDVGRNPVMRWFVPFFDGMIGKDYEAGMAKLKAMVEKG